MGLWDAGGRQRKRWGTGNEGGDRSYGSIKAGALGTRGQGRHRSPHHKADRQEKEGADEGFSEQRRRPDEEKWVGGWWWGGSNEILHGHVVELQLSGRHSRAEEGGMERRERNFYYQGGEMKRGQLWTERAERGSEGN